MNQKEAASRLKDYKFVAIGGGTGISTMLRGIKKFTENITAIITVADDGGGSGMIREDLNFLPPGDVRNCILALANTEALMDKLLCYRFTGGRLKGQSFGNLFLAAMCGICGGSFEEAVQRVSDILSVKGRVLPVSNQNVNLGARLSDGTVVLGESSIPKQAEAKHQSISELFLTPAKVAPVADCIKSIQEADCIILGPGSLYTSIIPNLLVEGISEEIRKSSAKKIYICNIMTQSGESNGFTAFDHVDAILRHAGPGVVGCCVANRMPVPESMQCKYKIENAYPVVVDEEKFLEHGIDLVKADLLDISKGVVRHNYDALADTILHYCLDTD